MNDNIYWLNENSRTILGRAYLREGVTPEARMEQIANHAESLLGIEGFAKKFLTNLHKGWYSLASPEWANFGAGRGLSISCNGSYISDTTDSILNKVAEVGMMTKYGAGTSGYFGEVRPRGAPINDGGTSFGSVHFMELFDKTISIVSQSNVRRGAFAAYLPIDHPDIKEFLEIGGTGNSIQHILTGVTISDAWMADLPNDREKRSIWIKILEKRAAKGHPYILFSDNMNKNKAQVYQDKNMTIHASNLCTEIALPSSEKESFVCCLASMNLLHWEDWKDTDAVEVLTYFLDAVIEDYVRATEKIPLMKAAYEFAKNHRALGVGTLGWHALLQSKMIPFESMEAKLLNVKVHKFIFEKTQKGSAELAELFGEPEMMKGYGRRNTTTTAIAPTTASSYILGQVSPSIEPLQDNFFIKDIEKMKAEYKNPFLGKVLEGYGKNTHEVWDDILLHGGSVQHLDFLTDHEKDVFKTFGEISQKEVIIQAAQRQRYIDQAQSLNVTIHPKTHPKEITALYMFAWEQGIKSLYYQFGTNPAQELGRSILSCSSCEA